MRILRNVGRVESAQGERGWMVLLLVSRRWSLDVYRWRDRKIECWWMPSVGVWWSMRLGRCAWQVRRR